MQEDPTNDNRGGALWISFLQAGLLGVVAGFSGYVLLSMVLEAPARAQGTGPAAGGFQGPPPFGPGGFPGTGEREIVAQFDKNGDKRLNTAERKAARAFLAADPGPRGGGFGRRGGPEADSARRHDPSVPGAQSDARRHEVLSIGAALRPRHAPHDLPSVRERGLGAGAAAFNSTDVEVPATAIVDGKTYKNVGVHFRGMSSYMMVPAGSKRSLNLSFDFVDGKQRLDGYSTLNLLNLNEIRRSCARSSTPTSRDSTFRRRRPTTCAS